VEGGKERGDCVFVQFRGRGSHSLQLNLQGRNAGLQHFQVGAVAAVLLRESPLERMSITSTTCLFSGRSPAVPAWNELRPGEFSRGKESIRAYGSIVMVGNFDVDVQHQQRVGHHFGPMPPEMRDDSAPMDRIHCYLPGWDVLKISEAFKTNHFGLVSDFISEFWTRLRSTNRLSVLQGRLTFGGALSGEDFAVPGVVQRRIVFHHFSIPSVIEIFNRH
jgi:hypothetical protein